MSTNEAAVKKSKFLNPERMAMIAIFAALMCVCSWISVPSPFNPSVPFTLQTLGIFLTGLLLSPLEAVFSSLVYLLLGICGLPILASFSTLYSSIGSPAGGYVIGFFIAPAVISLLKTAIFKALDPNFKEGATQKTMHLVTYLVLSIVVGTLIVDIPGIIQGMIITKMPLGAALVPFAFSFLPTDILKCIAASLLALALEKPYKMIRHIK